MASCLQYLRALITWLAEAKHTWLAVGVLVVAMVLSVNPFTSEPVIRLTGLVLQVFGVATVIWGISETRALFGLPSLVSKIKSWFGRFPKLRPRKASMGAGSASLVVGAKAKGHTTHSAGPNATVEARLESLERNIGLIYDRISESEREAEKEFNKISGALKEEELARKSNDKEIREMLEITETGGLHISAIGAVWIFAGIVLSTAAPEIEKLLK